MFPWPAPAPSARMALPASMLDSARHGDAPTLQNAAEALDALLMRAGYSQRAYFRLKDDQQTLGFALVTRMERMHADGTPYPATERFMPANAPDQFDVLSFVKSLFVAPVGYYRVIVITVARAPVATGQVPMAETQAEQLLSQGDSRLTGCVAGLPLTDHYAGDALIYEFRHAPEEQRAAADDAVNQLKPGLLDPGTHLRKAGILGARPPLR